MTYLGAYFNVAREIIVVREGDPAGLTTIGYLDGEHCEATNVRYLTKRRRSRVVSRGLKRCP